MSTLCIEGDITLNNKLVTGYFVLILHHSIIQSDPPSSKTCSVVQFSRVVFQRQARCRGDFRDGAGPSDSERNPTRCGGAGSSGEHETPSRSGVGRGRPGQPYLREEQNPSSEHPG